MNKGVTFRGSLTAPTDRSKKQGLSATGLRKSCLAMIVINRCRRCGRANPPEATICTACHQVLDHGITSAMHCPVCAMENPAGTQTCVRCRCDLVAVEQRPYDQRTVICPYCQVANPPPFRSDASAYCIRCGRQIRLPGANYSMAHFNPADARSGSRSRGYWQSGLRELAPRFAILAALGLMAALAPGLAARTRTIAELLFWVGLPLLMLAVRFLRG
jgi:hypothetical protein